MSLWRLSSLLGNVIHTARWAGPAGSATLIAPNNTAASCNSPLVNNLIIFGVGAVISGSFR